MKSKWHNISIQTRSFEDLQDIQKLLPIRASIPQVIEWLIKVGQGQIIKEKVETVETNYDNSSRIPK
jgi:hypothetical protein|tara:strand:- start:233 stop:433 length:201 start_codon:yes stop_codon:yes gene_type:complete